MVYTIDRRIKIYKTGKCYNKKDRRDNYDDTIEL